MAKIKNTYPVGSILRQGDLVITVIGTPVPKSVSKKDKILARGETTGHAHQFTAASMVNVYTDGAAIQYAEVFQPSVIVHQEHGNIPLPTGVYQIQHQRELDLLQQIHDVRD